jgi:hypothetical protein
LAERTDRQHQWLGKREKLREERKEEEEERAGVELV